MKKMIAMAVCLMTVLALSACGQKTEHSDSFATEADTYPNVSMELFDEDINLNLVTLKVVNNNDFGIESGNMNDFWIEEYRDGKWQSIVVDERDNTGELMVFYGQQLLQIDISSVYGELSEGHYRILKGFTTQKPDDMDTFYLSAEFDIK